jgi:hypothetical protein
MVEAADAAWVLYCFKTRFRVASSMFQEPEGLVGVGAGDVGGGRVACPVSSCCRVIVQMSIIKRRAGEPYGTQSGLSAGGRADLSASHNCPWGVLDTFFASTSGNKFNYFDLKKNENKDTGLPQPDKQIKPYLWITAAEPQTNAGA